MTTSHRIGVRASTFAALAGQLAAEPGNPWRSTRRRTMQAVVAPAILQSFGVAVPGYMHEPGVLGRQLVPHSVGTF